MKELKKFRNEELRIFRKIKKHKGENNKEKPVFFVKKERGEIKEIIATKIVILFYYFL